MRTAHVSQYDGVGGGVGVGAVRVPAVDIAGVFNKWSPLRGGGGAVRVPAVDIAGVFNKWSPFGGGGGCSESTCCRHCRSVQ